MEDTRTKEQKRADALEKWNSSDDLSNAMPMRLPLDCRKQNELFWAKLCEKSPFMAKRGRPPMSIEDIENMTEEDNERIYQELYKKYLEKKKKRGF